MRSDWNRGKIATIEPNGYITAAHADELQRQLATAVAAQNYSVCLVDMSKVEFLDSAGLMALVGTFRLAQRMGKRLSLCSIAPNVRMIFELTQLDRVLEIFDNRDAFELEVNYRIIETRLELKTN